MNHTSFMEGLHWLEDLNEPQLKAVTYRQAPLLTLAGPGSGKTRIITRRIAWLTENQQELPESILAVTFTNRAAEEMRERLFQFLGEKAEGVWVHTFHAVAMRILRKFGDRIGIPTDFMIIDEDDQRRAIARQLRELNLSRETYSIGEIAAQISRAKHRLRSPESDAEGDPAVHEVIHLYESWLRAQNALDFDDLLRYAVFLLREEDAVRTFYRQTLRHILVDEYQDINKAQYELLCLLAPPGASITAVADDDQTIYGWRGSDPSFVDAFIRRYDPAIIKLPYSYRCPPSILYGAQHLIARERKPDARRNFMQSKATGEDRPIYHYIFHSIHQEHAWLVKLIQKLMAERDMKQRDFAILYRTHRLGGPAEQALLEAGFNVHRIRPKDFFDRFQAKEVVRYLQLARAASDQDIASALNFPVHQVDEITMVALRKLAQKHAMNLIELIEHIHEFGDEITPLTRHHLQGLLRLAREESLPLESDAEEAVAHSFALLQTLRSPWRRPNRQQLAQLFEQTRCADKVEALRAWLQSNRPFILLHDEQMDSRLAAFLLQQVLRDYLHREVETHPAETFDWTTSAAVVYFGNAADAFATPEAITFPNDAFSQTVWAWRFAQQLLISYEKHLAHGRFIFYDVETTGANPRRDEIIEIAAWAYEHRRPSGEPFHTLVRPQRGYIPRAATNIHGIRYEDVADAPDIEEVLPQFLDYIGDDTLVGHNIRRFDNRFIDKACSKLFAGKGFYPHAIDTLRLARRLLPDLDHYSLEHLSHALNLHNGAIQHRSLEDLEVTADLFYLLADYLLLEKEQEALAEYLPLVGVSILAQDDSETPWRTLLLDAAARVIQARQKLPYLEDLLSMLSSELQRPLHQALQMLTGRRLPQNEEDYEWQTLESDFLQHVAAFKQHTQDHSLRAFLDYQALLNNVDTFAHEADKDAITMMTLHNAKGTEFPIVIIIGVEQENLPIWRSLNDPAKLAEERRVFYVGITRAQKAVYLFSTNDREDGFLRRPSQFAFEIPSKYIRHFRIHADGRIQEIKTFRPSSSRQHKNPKQS